LTSDKPAAKGTHDGERDDRPVIADYELVPIGELREHEAIDMENLAVREKDIVGHGGVVPIVAEREHKVILNGHHRYNALKRLGAKRVPVYFVDYYSPDVRLELWPESSVCSLSKRDVVKMGMGKGVFPPKTTRHTFAYRFMRKRVSLSELM
jgi:hypothetical protein